MRNHGISLFGDLKYPPSFSHFDYVNPRAPKGGLLRLAGIGTFDSLNPFILKGIAADEISLTFDTLLEPAADETLSAYGRLAESVEKTADGKSVTFTIRKNALWHDGKPITSEDVVFTFNLLMEKGHPQYRAYYHEVKKAEALSPQQVKFTFTTSENRELPILVGQLPILPKHFFTDKEFEQTGLTPILGSGPYRVGKVDSGRSIAYERVKDYWGKDLPVNRGRFNFDTIRVDYYRDETVAIEALKAGEYDFRKENIAKNWATGYNIPQVEDGRMTKEALPDGTPSGMQCFIFNLRRTPFNNPKFREALFYAYDFEWANKNLFFSAYGRNNSFFTNSPFASDGLPDKAELKLLAPFRTQLPPRLFSENYTIPSTDGSGNNRANLLKATQLLKEGGFFLRDMKLINPETDKPVEIEFLMVQPAFQRIVGPFIQSLKKLGIEGKMRLVDSSQYIKRFEEFDFDMSTNWFTQGATPGNEQINYWHSGKADVKGSRNYGGIKNPAVDAMVDRVVRAQSMGELTTAAHALDRVLLWNFYVIPQWHSRTHRAIYWNTIKRPDITPPYALGVTDTWWSAHP